MQHVDGVARRAEPAEHLLEACVHRTRGGHDPEREDDEDEREVEDRVEGSRRRKHEGERDDRRGDPGHDEAREGREQGVAMVEEHETDADPEGGPGGAGDDRLEAEVVADVETARAHRGDGDERSRDDERDDERACAGGATKGAVDRVGHELEEERPIRIVRREERGRRRMRRRQEEERRDDDDERSFHLVRRDPSVQHRLPEEDRTAEQRGDQVDGVEADQAGAEERERRERARRELAVVGVADDEAAEHEEDVDGEVAAEEPMRPQRGRVSRQDEDGGHASESVEQRETRCDGRHRRPFGRSLEHANPRSPRRVVPEGPAPAPRTPFSLAGPNGGSNWIHEYFQTLTKM